VTVATIDSVLMVGHEDTLSSTLFGLTVFLNSANRSVLIDAEIRKSSEFNILVDMFLLLWSGESFLLFLLLTSLNRDHGLEVHQVRVQRKDVADFEFLSGREELKIQLASEFTLNLLDKLLDGGSW
jgi:hypothetical protein